MFTKEEKKAYFKRLRDQWNQAKLTADTDQIKAIIQNHGWKISVIGYAVIAHQMKAQDLKGYPYLDAKTYKGWKENGFQVKKGKKSTLTGITWINAFKKNDDPSKDDDCFLMPKGYHLFHRSQVEEI